MSNEYVWRYLINTKFNKVARDDLYDIAMRADSLLDKIEKSMTEEQGG